MELGMLMMPLHRPERPFLTVLREDQEAVVLADELGFSEVYVGEHYSNKPEQITSPFIFLATLIERTRRIKFGTGVINLPQQHPAIVAAHAAMFDQLAEGRFIFGIGPGGSPGDFEMFKLSNPPDRPRMMQESIETILKIWSQEPPYEFPGGYWDFRIRDAYRKRSRRRRHGPALPDAASAHRGLDHEPALGQRPHCRCARLDPESPRTSPLPATSRPTGRPMPRAAPRRVASPIPRSGARPAASS